MNTKKEFTVLTLQGENFRNLKEAKRLLTLHSFEECPTYASTVSKALKLLIKLLNKEGGASL